MQVRDIMTEHPTCCRADDTLQDAAELMAADDCGEIPVIDDDGRLIGVVTDRDIVCRGLARSKGRETAIEEVMSSPVVSVGPDSTLEACCQSMDENQVRRMPVVDEAGRCCGIVALADIVRNAPADATIQLVRDVSVPTAPAASTPR